MHNLKLMALKLSALDVFDQSRYLSKLDEHQRLDVIAYINEISSRYTKKHLLSLDFSRFFNAREQVSDDVVLKLRFTSYTLSHVLSYISHKPEGFSKVLLSAVFADHKDMTEQFLGNPQIKAYGAVDKLKARSGLVNFVLNDFREFINEQNN